MQAVILAAGKSTRTHPLTLTRHKTMLPIANKPILEHTLDALEGSVDEVIVIVGYLKESIMKTYGKIYKGMKLTYIEQKEQKGTGHALALAKDILKDKFILIYGDDYYCKEDVCKCIKFKYSALAKKVENPEQFGIFKLKKDGSMDKLIEKPNKFVGDLASIGIFVLDKTIFQHEIIESERGELEVVDYVSELAKNETVNIVESSLWVPTTYPWSLLESNKELLKKIKKDIKGEVEPYATLKGEIIVGEGTLIKNGAYIEGPVIIGKNCVIGPNCFIRGSTSIGNGCKIGNGVEVKNSILFQNVSIGHLSYIGDSVIGENTNIGAGNVTANLRHDNKNMKSIVKGELVDTGRRKLGMIFSDNVHTGINSSFYPARKMWPSTTTLPGEIVKKDIFE